MGARMEAEAYLEMAAIENRHWWFAGRRKIIKSILSQMEWPPNPEILEIGCGTGGNLDLLASFGEVNAMEMDERARELARQKTGDRVRIKSGHCPDNIPFEGGKFDLICLFDVLEHIERDEETLLVIEKMLKPDGFVLITVPAYQWLWSVHDDFLHHKRRYTAGLLRQKLRNSGLHIKRLTYFNILLFPLAVIARLFDAVSGKSRASGSSVPRSPLNRFLEKVFSLEAGILNHANLPFGVSILMVLEHEQKS